MALNVLFFFKKSHHAGSWFPVAPAPRGKGTSLHRTRGACAPQARGSSLRKPQGSLGEPVKGLGQPRVGFRHGPGGHLPFCPGLGRPRREGEDQRGMRIPKTYLLWGSRAFMAVDLSGRKKAWFTHNTRLARPGPRGRGAGERDGRKGGNEVARAPRRPAMPGV